MNYEGNLADALVDDILAAIYKYDETMVLPTVLGCLDLVKLQLIQDHMTQEDDDE